MKNVSISHTLAIGLAIFSMFFGAGNIIYPLAVGQYAGSDNLYAMTGLLITAAFMPIAGVISMILFEGNIRQFFGCLGKRPGFVLALIIITLLGPLGSTPRCIALSYVTLKNAFLNISSVAFGAIACLIIFLFTIRKRHILTLLGWVLTPTLLFSLIVIIVLGCITAKDIQPIHQNKSELFFYGLKEGYNTMDLLAAFFFSSTILNILRKSMPSTDRKESTYINIAVIASLIGAGLLGCVYIGFSYLAAFHGGSFLHLDKSELLSAITLKVAGPYAGVLVCVMIALACLTTAIALISAFTDFIQKDVFREKISYEITLIGSLLLTFFVSTFEFTGISAFLGPILEICYPGLIILTFLNILSKISSFKFIKIPVFIFFVLATYIYFNPF